MTSSRNSAGRRAVASLLPFLVLSPLLAAPAEPPVIPAGSDAYLQWDQWPRQRLGARAYMRSTYDRRGGNEGADASHFLYQLADDNNVTLDVEGRGILYFARYNHWHGSPWRYVTDGTEHIVQESSTADPNRPVTGSVFLPEQAFPSPLAFTWSTTKGADLSWVPIAFEKSFRMGYSRTHYGTGYYIYHLYDPDAKLSQPIRSWDGKSPPPQAVLDLIARAGSDISPASAQEISGAVEQLDAAQPAVLLRLAEAPATLRKISFSVPREQALAFGRARLKITWDGRRDPSVDAPLALFFGAGTLYNRDSREHLVKALPVNIRYAGERVELACYFPMPFFQSARIELAAPANESLRGIAWSVKHEPLAGKPSEMGYFHATFRDHANPLPGHDLVLLDTRETEGGGDWSGSFIGSSWIFSMNGNLTTLEGDPRFFFDDSQSPQAYGTGTEEWGGGGDYWGGLNMTLPFAGHPVGARSLAEAKNEEDKIQSAYRFLLADLMPFGKNAVIRLEHGGNNTSTEHYQTVAYWYGAPAPALVKTDELKIGDPASEQAHRYHSPEASAPYQITSRYEWGVDSFSPPQDEEKPAAQPRDYAEFEFEAEANRTYYIWARGANLDGDNTSDAFWIQFDEDIGTVRLGSGHAHDKGFGNWLDGHPAGAYAWSSALPKQTPQTVTFQKSGQHKLRLQPRHRGHRLQQIWLSATQKTEPGNIQPKSEGRNEIVLRAADAARLAGEIKQVSDKNAGPVLSIGVKKQIEVYPAHTDIGRKTLGRSEFTVRLDANNQGVLLRRKLDYQFPNQRAEVWVADGEGGEWKQAGIWHLAGSNTCIYSNPPEELGETRHIVQTSNRRFRDDEFLLPRRLTQGRSSIRVQIRFTPARIPLFPGHPLPELAWSEIRYDAYCYVLPDWKPVQTAR